VYSTPATTPARWPASEASGAVTACVTTSCTSHTKLRIAKGRAAARHAAQPLQRHEAAGATWAAEQGGPCCWPARRRTVPALAAAAP
jgi:hypothetical protein